jgi:hypothetical protein
MNKYCSAALVTSVAVLSLTACSARITSASPPGSSPATSPAAASSPGTATSAGSGTTVHVGGSIGSFPIPSGAKVVESVNYGKQIAIILSSVSPGTVSSFYASALPRAGYTITRDSLATLNNVAGLAIDFAGHGYKGTIGAVSGGLASAAAIFGGDSKNMVGITLTEQ